MALPVPTAEVPCNTVLRLQGDVRPLGRQRNLCSGRGVSGARLTAMAPEDGVHSVALCRREHGVELGARGDHMRRDRLAEALKGIQLSDAQRTKVDAIRSKYRDSLTALRSKSNSDSSQDRRQQFRDLMRRQMADIRGELTSEQQQVFDKNVDQMRAQRRRQEGGDSTRS